MTAMAEHNTDDTHRWVSFRLGGENYAVNVMKVSEVLTQMDFAKVAGAPEFVVGIVNLRGNVVTVIDAHKRFNLPGSVNSDDSRVIVLESENVVVGMLVDAVREVIDVPIQSIQPSPQVAQGDQNNRAISGVVHMNDLIYILVDVDILLSDAQVDLQEH